MRLKKTTEFSLLCLLALVVFSRAALAETPDAAAPLVLKNALIHTMSSDGSFVGSVVITDGKISSVSKKLDKVPAGAQVIDLDGYVIVPGLIDARSNLWLSSAAVAARNTRGELNVVDSIDPWNEDWREVASQGITSVYVQPSNRSTLGGHGAVLCVGDHQTLDEIVLKEKAGLQAAVGITGTTSRARHSQIQRLNSAIKKVKDQLKKEAEKKKKEEEEKKKKAAEAKKKNTTDARKAAAARRLEAIRKARRKGRRPAPKTPDKKDSEKEKPEKKDTPDSGKPKPKEKPAPDKKKPKTDKPVKKPADDKAKSKDNKNDKDKKDSDKKPDPTRDLWKPVIEGKIPLHVEVHHADSAKQLLAMAKELEIKIVLDGLSKCASFADEIVDSNRPVVVGPMWSTGAEPAYRRDADFDWVKTLAENGNTWSLATFARSPRGSRMLRYHAAAAISKGVSIDAALKALTISPARMLGVDDQIGSIESGKNADLAVFAGDPLNPSTPTRMVICGGKIIHQSDANSLESFDTTAGDDLDLPEKLSGRYAIKTTRLLIEGEFKPGTIIVNDGELKNVSTDPEIATEDLTVFDVGDSPVTPGLVVAHSHLGQQRLLVADSESDASHLRAIDIADPSSQAAKKMLAGGFTTVGFAPLSSSTSPGMMGQMCLGNGDCVENPSIASKFVLSDSARARERFPSSLTGQIQMLNDLFAGKLPQSRIYLTPSIKTAIANQKKAAIAEVSAGKRMAIVEADEPLEIRSALKMMQRLKLKGAILSSGRELYQHAQELQSSGVGIVLRPVAETQYDNFFKRVVDLCKTETPIAFAGETPQQIRFTASMLVAAGLPRQQALKGLTTAAAKMTGMENAGQYEGVGKKANFVIWSETPLNLSAKPIQIVVAGDCVQIDE